MSTLANFTQVKKTINLFRQPQNILNLLFFICSILLLIFPSIKNGYPLLYTDSATYIVSGHDGFVPIDRPVVYGFLIRHISLSSSMWYVVVLQALVVVILLRRLTSYFTFRLKKSMVTFLLVLFLTLFTGISNYASQIMPDLFTGILILAFTMLFVEPSNSWRWVLWSIVLISSMMHFSNLLLATAISVLSFGWMLIFCRHSEAIKPTLIRYAGLAILPWVLLPLVNYLYTGEYFLNKSGHVFFTARLIETGCLKDFFDAEPSARDYSLYQAKDHLPEKVSPFIWNDDSPLYQGGCVQRGGWTACWKEKRDEYNRMIKAVLSNRRILFKFIKVSLVDWGKQLVDFDTGLMDKQGENSGFAQIIPNHLDDAKFYRSSKQFHETLTFDTGSRIQRWSVGISLLTLTLLLFFLPVIRFDDLKKLRLMFIVILIALSGNALVCSVFSGVLNRYQGRAIWLIPLLTGLYLLLIGIEKFQKSKLPDSESVNEK